MLLLTWQSWIQFHAHSAWLQTNLHVAHTACLCLCDSRNTHRLLPRREKFIFLYAFCTVHCNIITQYKPTKCTFSKSIFQFLIFESLLYVSKPRFIFRKTAGCVYSYDIVRSLQINHQPEATIFQFIILTFIYSWTCFGRSPAHHQELNDCSSSLWFYLRIGPRRPRTQHGYYHVLPPIIRSSMTAVAASGFTFVSGRPDHEHSTAITTIRR
jgi:hypothetical protein